MIVVRIQGGLGNQMFQYAYARRLQHMGKEVRLHWHPSRRKSFHTGYSLDTIFAGSLSQYVPLSNDGLLSQIAATLRRKLLRVRQGSNVGYDPTLLSVNSGYIDGYFQSERYFSEFADELKLHFTFKQITDSKNAELLKWIDAGFVAAIHIRGGDYLNRGKHAGDMATVCGAEYYRTAIELVKSRFPAARFLVFSDDFEYARTIMSEEEFMQVDWNRGSDSWKDMALMARCQAHIIANSSFSWWGAWLANSQLRIMPSPWFPIFAKSYNKDIYLPDSLVVEQNSAGL